VAMYLAMNYFRLGDQEKAEQLIEKAARAGTPDPDVFYCHAIINVRKDPAGAVRDLERYMALTSGRPDVNESKQKRVRQTMDLLEKCTAEGAGAEDAKACVEREVFEKARALAFEEHLAPMRGEKGAGEGKGMGKGMGKGEGKGMGKGMGEGQGEEAPPPKGTKDERLPWLGVTLGLILLGMIIWCGRFRRR